MSSMNIHKLKQMIAEPSSKEWFAKHAKGKALNKVKKLPNKKQNHEVRK